MIAPDAFTGTARMSWTMKAGHPISAQPRMGRREPVEQRLGQDLNFAGSFVTKSATKHRVSRKAASDN
jgi:hypothetical protein